MNFLSSYKIIMGMQRFNNNNLHITDNTVFLYKILIIKFNNLLNNLFTVFGLFLYFSNIFQE